MSTITREEALNYHSEGRPGKIEVIPTKPYSTQYDLSLAYSPGVAEPCLAIAENPELYVDNVYGETVAGGTGYLYLSPVPYEKLGFDTRIQNSSYPALTKGFLYSVPSVFVLVPTLLLGIHEATKTNKTKQNKNEDYE